MEILQDNPAAHKNSTQATGKAWYFEQKQRMQLDRREDSSVSWQFPSKLPAQVEPVTH